MNRKWAVEDKLRSLGAPTGRSFRDTVEVALLVTEDEDAFCHIPTPYTIVAQDHSTKPSNISRNISYLVRCCWDRNPAGVNELFGCDLTARPNPTQFIGALVAYLLRLEEKEHGAT